MLLLSRLAIRHPAAALLVAALVVAAFVPGLKRLELRTDGRALVPAHAPEVEVDARLRAEFGINDPAVVLIDTGKPNGIYDVRVLQLLQALSRRVQDVPEIGALNVSSLDTEPSDRYRPGTLRFYPLLEPFPEAPEDLERLRLDVESNGLYGGTITAADGSAATVLFGVPDGTDRLALCNRLWAIVAEEVAAAAARDSTGSTTHASVHVLGAPFAETLLGGHILQDLGIPDRFLGARAPQRTAGDTPAPTGLFALRRWVGTRIGLLPLAIVVMTVVFLVGYRKVAAPLLPLAQVASCLVVVFGAMGYAGTPVYLTTAVLPIILTCIGIESEIHLLGQYRQLVAAGSVPGDKRAVVLATLQEMTRPVVGTSLTTAIGFLSFALSSMQPVQAFGLFAALGIVCCMLWSLGVTPALLAVLPQGWLATRRAGRPLRLGVAERLVAGVMRRRRLVLAATAALVAVSWFGVRRIQVQDSWIDGFDPQSDLYRATQTFNAGFYGPHVLQVLVDMGHDSLRVEVPELVLRNRRFVLPVRWSASAARLEQAEIRVTVPDSSHFTAWDPTGLSTHTWSAPVESVFVAGDSLVLTTAPSSGSPQLLLRLNGDENLVVEVETKRLETPAGLRAVRALEDFIVSHDELTVGGALGPPDYIATTNFILMRRDPAARGVPDEPRHVPGLWRHYGRVRGEHFVYRVVSDDGSRGLVTVYLKNANYRDTRALMQAIRDYEREHLKPQGIHLSFAGDVAVSQALIGAIVQTQTQSILLSLLGILALGILLTRSLRFGLFIVLPCSVAVLLNFAFMGWTGMPLGVATSMFAAMILGTGVDFAIHLIERYRRERAAGSDVEPALIAAAQTCGPPILIDSAAMALGFGILTLSQVPANARLGAIAVLCIVTCLVATLVLLPAVMRTWSGKSGA